MMDLNKFKLALTFVSKWEWSNKDDGGYTNDPNDPGGETKFGISKRNHPNVDIKNLTAQQALDIYQQEYWLPLGGDNLPVPICVAAFDTAVHCGLNKTLYWLRQVQGDWSQLLALRKQYYLNLVKQKPSLGMFLKGWLNRLADLQKYCEITSLGDLEVLF